MSIIPDLVPDDVVADACLDHPLGGDEVVEPPPHVLRTAVHHVRPERVGLLLLGRGKGVSKLPQNSLVK